MYKVIISEGFRRLSFAPANMVRGRNYCPNNGVELVINATKVKLESKFNPERTLIHEFCGEYEFEKLSQPILKGIKRDLIALKIKQAQKVKIEFWKTDGKGWSFISRDTISLFDCEAITKRVKNTILELIRINKTIN